MQKNVLTEDIHLETGGTYDMIDITHHVAKLITDRRLQNGLLNVFVEHTTCAIAINEFNDPKLLNDFKKKLSKFSPEDAEYEHNESHICNGDGCVNGHSHCNALFLPTSITCQVVHGKLKLGTWQRIFLIELDRARPRNIQLMFVGE